MGLRKFRADRIFDGHRFHGSDRVLVATDSGTIEGILDLSDAGDDIETLPGTLSPGFVNAHCHLELSHLKGVIPPHTGLIEFLCSVVTKRDFSPQVIQDAIVGAEAELAENGTVAVGDIGNTADTATVKARSRIRWQNFVEVLSFTDDDAEKQFRHYSGVAAAMERALMSVPVPHRTSLVPHAPYSISPNSFQLIDAATEGQIISIHNQEHPAENELYRTGGGPYLDFFKIFGMDRSPFPVTGKSSIRSVLPHFTKNQRILLVHNTFMPEEDVDWANRFAAEQGLRLVYCLCVNANRYIENRLPPAETFVRNGCHIVLGTDSYSSNWQLSMAREIETARAHFPTVPEELVWQWATLNGALALDWNDDLGSFEPGKRPGIVAVTDEYVSRRLL
ncbi:MAG: hypothetical protein RJA57_108 [Bacteroidota bacterium]